MSTPTNNRVEGFPVGCEWFHTVDDALEKMLDAIACSRKSVRLEVYIFDKSAIGERFRAALVEACQRGVAVYVMVDALGSYGLPNDYFEPLKKAGGEFRWFNPLRLTRIGFRDHRKMLVVDDATAFVGGFNIAENYRGDGVTKGWHDTSVRLSAEFALELGSIFDGMFQLAGEKPRPWVRFRKNVNQRVITISQGQIITSGPNWRGFKMQQALCAAVQKARCIQIISAYFLPPRQIRKALAKAAKRGAIVTLILAAKTDVSLAQSAARRLYTGLLKAGIRIFEYQPQVLHSKLFLFDDAVFVGSANLDKRSLHINYELLVRLETHHITQQAQRFFEQAISHSQEITLEQWRKSRSFLTWLREQWAWFLLAQVDPYLAYRQFTWLRGEVLSETRKKK